jgi:hypothetical protein
MINEPTIGSAVLDCVDISSLSSCHLTYLNALFTAISDASKELSTTHTLASIGRYLTDDWVSDMDCQHREFNLLRKRIYGEDVNTPQQAESIEQLLADMPEDMSKHMERAFALGYQASGS